MNNKPLMKYRSSFNNENSWALLPLIKDSPIVSGIYDPTEGVLALVISSKRETFKMVKKLDDTGSPIQINKMGGMKMDNFKQERVRLESFFEHYLSHPDDIKYILENYAENNFEFNDVEKNSLILKPDISI